MRVCLGACWRIERGRGGEADRERGRVSGCEGDSQTGAETSMVWYGVDSEWMGRDEAEWVALASSSRPL